MVRFPNIPELFRCFIAELEPDQLPVCNIQCFLGKPEFEPVLVELVESVERKVLLGREASEPAVRTRSRSAQLLPWEYVYRGNIRFCQSDLTHAAFSPQKIKVDQCFIKVA